MTNDAVVRVKVRGVPKGRKFWSAMIFGSALIVVLVVLLAYGVRSETVLIAWMAAFVAIPTQFSIANAAVTRAFAKPVEPSGPNP